MIVVRAAAHQPDAAFGGLSEEAESTAQNMPAQITVDERASGRVTTFGEYAGGPVVIRVGDTGR
jgi:hypothetical protein